MQSKNSDGISYNNGFEYGVRHLLSPRSGLVSEILNEVHSDFSPAFFTELLQLGSIYVEGKRLMQDSQVAEKNYIRVHFKPRRFPKDEKQWSQRIVFQNEDFIVVNKPAGLPVHASVDNRLENLHVYLSAFCQQELFVTHRLDVPTRGLIVFAKTKSFLAEFNRLLSERAVQKIYRAVTVGARLEEGLYTHWMEPSPRAPKKVSAEFQTDWQECRLQILSASPAKTVKEVVTSEQELTIELLTGRTHQIRAQLSALQAPIRGDVMYGAEKFYSGEEIDLTAERLKFLSYSFTLCR